MNALRIPDTRSRLDIPAGKCKVCKGDFIKFNSLQTICAKLRCLKQAGKLKRREEAAELKKRKEAVKSRSQWMKEAQNEFNRYIRLRDRNHGCICCGRKSSGSSLGGEFDAGHYRSRGAASHLRFDERNVHAQLKHCNRYAFDSSAYRAGLCERIGEREVEALEADNSKRKFSIGDLAAIKGLYRSKSRALEQASEAVTL